MNAVLISETKFFSKKEMVYADFLVNCTAICIEKFERYIMKVLRMKNDASKNA